MLLPLFVTLLPALFLSGLIQKAAALRRRHIDMDGDPPISKAFFVSSKYAIVIVWSAMVVQSWGVDLSVVDVPGPAKGVSICLWILGFALLFSGRIVLGDSFRIGSPREDTGLKQTGLYRFSRNPMYVGVYATLCAAVVRAVQSHSASRRRVRDCRPPPDCARRGGTTAAYAWRGVSNLLQPSQAIPLKGPGFLRLFARRHSTLLSPGSYGSASPCHAKAVPPTFPMAAPKSTRFSDGRSTEFAQRGRRPGLQWKQEPTMTDATGDDLGRNDACHCGSGRKYKHCCLDKDEAAAHAKASTDAQVEARTDQPAEALDQQRPPKPRSYQPWKRSATNTHSFQRMSTPRKVGGS